MNLEKNETNGFINLYKEKNISSAHALNILKAIIKKKYGKIKIGHAGTLDPLAIGVLPVAIGKATKTIEQIMDKEKIYAFEITFGEQRDTDDAEGTIIKTNKKTPTEKEIKEILPEFLGDIEQKPPLFSAIKINGQRAYKLAREDKITLEDLPIKKVKTKSIHLIKTEKNKASFEITCGRAFYIRSFARDLSQKLNTCGYISSLTRTKCGLFTIKQALKITDIEKKLEKEDITSILIPIETVLRHQSIAD